MKRQWRFKKWGNAHPPSNVNLIAIHLHGWSIGWKVYTRKKQLGVEEEEEEEDASRRADRQINIGNGHVSSWCILDTAYRKHYTCILPPGVCTRGGCMLGIQRRRIDQLAGERDVDGGEWNRRTEEKKEETKLGWDEGDRGDKQRRLSWPLSRRGDFFEKLSQNDTIFVKKKRFSLFFLGTN